LAQSGRPLPPVLRLPASLALSRRLEQAVADQDSSAAIAIARAARGNGFSVDTPRAQASLEASLLDAAHRGATDEALSILDLARQLDLPPDVDRAQEVVYE